ncbi:hypothetical protein MN032_11075 [Agromyces atrinae]|uniref:phage terminase small subunit n=1 Tax=Agromyces atrinae TaxID=592376 RepID=UPI001F585E2B|nr:hypothetical protein [Agromyces atrinae]MCI2958240.1 hypothetical protein [Agromyces atrinae]
MGGLGPAPAEKRSRDRDNATRDTVRSDGMLGGFELPDDVLPFDKDGVREQWHTATQRWWDNWRRSPQGVRMLTDPDWDYLLDTALLHHLMWQTGGRNSERASEIRLRVAAFGATPADRLRLRIEVEVPTGEEYPVGNAGNVTPIDSDRRKRVTGAG